MAKWLSVLVEIKFDYLNALCHKFACKFVSFKFVDLYPIHQIAKLKTLPKVPTIWYIPLGVG